MLNYIIWDVTPEIIDGFHIRWYGLFFAIGFFISYLCIKKIFNREGLTNNDADSLTFGTFIFLLVGLRLGHCLFYEPDVYLSNPIKILYVWEGGLASHGGAIGLVCAFIWFAHKSKKSFMWVMSRVAIVVPVTAFFVRMGNLMNSEIYGISTSLPWGFVFVRDATIQTNATDLSNMMLQAGLISQENLLSLQHFLLEVLPERAVSLTSLRDALIESNFLEPTQVNDFIDACVKANLLTTNHPTQIYEAFTYLTTGGILVTYYQLRTKHQKPISNYVISAIAFLMIFGTRFCFEFIKNNQVDFEQNMTLDMGQWLSIPFILCGLFFIAMAIREKKQANLAQ